jgi:glycosyltransferase involved in cell wall biosynthesis
MVAPRLAAQGWEVSVIGGDPEKMEFDPQVVRWRPGFTTRQVATELTRLGPLDVVHAHMTAAEVAAVLTKPYHRARLVTTQHFASPRGSRRSLSPLPMLAHFIDEQIAISEFVATASSVSRVLPNGVEASDSGQTYRDQSVLVLQRLEVEKRTEIALRAWSLSSLRQKGWRLAIAGRGSQLPQLQRLAHHLNVKESTDWLGFLHDPREILSVAGVLLAPAAAEPFGLTVVEAMARATPVVAADGGAHRETLGHQGWLFPVDDVGACAQLLDQVDKQDLAAYGAHLRSRQRELFDIEDHVNGLTRIYKELTV